MSLSRLDPTDNYSKTAELADEQLSKLENKLSEETGTSNLIDAVIKKIEDNIRILEREEEKLLEAFGIKGIKDFKLAEAELQAKFASFNQTSGLVNLTGPQIEESFLKEYRISADENMREMQQYIDKYVIPNMKKYLETDGTKVTGENLRKAFNASIKDIRINLDLTKGSTKIVTTRSAAGIIKENDEIKVLASNLSKRQAEIINDMRSYGKKHGEPELNSKLKIEGNVVSVEFISEWYDLTRMGGVQALTESQIEKMIKSNAITIKQLNSVNKRITNLIASQTNCPELVSKYIKKMLNKDDKSKYMFFVGKNVNAITGLLGEISAVVAISNLLVNENPDKILNWVANNKVNNKKLSVDILLKGIGNIQVKNTAKDLVEIPEISVDFAKGNVDYILGKLESGYKLDTDIFRSVLESESFNVPVKYYYPGPMFYVTSINTTFRRKPDSWDDFVQAYNLMTNVISKTHVFLTMFAPDFLYMTAPENFTEQLAVFDRTMDGFVGQGIHLYLVGGIPHLASEQLQVIKQDLENLKVVKDAEQHFTIRTVFSSIERDGEKVPYDYAAYKNKESGGTKAKLTSSYVFTNK